ncbi:retrovirus-related pol polyprotein from transposon TNT 1-94 [Tanacetum coccineum]
MDVKSAFLYGTIEEEVYVCQPLGFEDPQFPDKVYKVEKALYGLHQAPKAWYETLSTYLLENGYRRGTIDKTLFIKKDKGDILLVHVYVDDIIFGSTKKSLCVEFEQMMHKRFHMSSKGELNIFLRLQAGSTPIETNKALNKDEEAKDVDVHLYRSMIGSLMYLTTSRPDIMFDVCACARFQQTIVADSTTKAEYVATANCYGADETVYKEWEDRMERATTTASSLEAEQDNVNAVRLNLLLPVLVYAARHSLTTVRDNLMLLGITSYCWKPEESNGFEEIIDFLNIQALVDKKKVIISETSIRSDLKLDDAEGTDCLPTAIIFVELERMGAKTTSWNEFSSTMASAIIFFLDKQLEGMSKHKGVYVTPSHTKKVFANMKRPSKGFSGRVTPLFSTMMVQAITYMGADSATPTDSHSIPIITQPSSSKPQKKKSRRKQRKDNAPTEPTTKETTHEEHVSTPSYDPPPSGEDRMQLAELMSLCTNLQEKVLDLEKAKTAQAKEITSLKKRVKQLEKKRKLRTSGLRRLRKGRKIEDLDADAEVTLVNETQEMNDDNLMFDIGVLEEQEIEFEKVVEEPVVSVAITTKLVLVSDAEVVTTASASVVIPDELTLAQTLIEIKTTKPKPVTTAATIVTYVRPRAKGIIFHDQEEHVPASTKIFSSSQSQLTHVKDKGKGKMVEPEVPLKKKDQVALDEEMARNLEAQLQAKLIKEERLARKKEEEANIALIELWDNTQAIMEVDFELAQRLQAKEQGEITIEKRSRLFVELMNRRKKHFVKLRAEEIRRKPPTKAHKRNQMYTYLKNMAG